MTNIFTVIFHYLKQRRGLRFAILAVFIIIPAWFAAHIGLEEDISGFMPKDQQSARINFVYKNMSIADKMIVRFSLTDTASSDKQMLMQAADGFAFYLDSLTSEKDLIKEVLYQVDQQKMFAIADFITQNIPYFLTDGDYARIDSQLTESRVRTILENNKKILVSPAGMVLKRTIIDDPLHLSSGVLNRLKAFQVSDQYSLFDGFIFSKDGKNLLLFITTANSSSETSRNARLIAYIDQSIANCKLQSGNKLNVTYFGAAAIAVTNAHQIKTDSYISIIIALILILLLLYWFFRSLKPILLIAVPVVFGAILALAAMFFIKGSISAIAIGAGSAIFGIAINYSLHFLIHSRHEQNPAIVIKELASPMVTGSITTVGAFLSLLFISSESMRDFGLFAAFTLAGTLLFTLIFMPHFTGNQPAHTGEKATGILARLSEYRFERNRYILLFTFLLTAIFFWFSFRVAFEADMNKINYMKPEQRKAFEELSAFTSLGKKSIYLVSEGKTLDEALQHYEQTRGSIDSLVNDSTLLYANGIGGFLPSDSMQQIRLAKWNCFWSERRNKVMAILRDQGSIAGFNPNSFDHFEAQLQKEFKVEKAGFFAPITDQFAKEYLIEQPERSMVISILYYLPQKGDQFVHHLTNSNTFAFDSGTIAKTLINTLSADFNKVLYICSLLVLIFLTISFGRIELGLISFLPMLMSWIWILGMMPLLDIRFNIVNIILATFIFGLGDDYTVFMIDGLMNEYAYGKKLLNSYKTTVILSAITMLIGIGTLVFAKHPAMRSLGNVTIIGMLAVVVISFIVPPLLYSWLTTKNRRKRLIPITIKNLSASIFAFVYFLCGSLILSLQGFWLLTLHKPTPERKLRFHRILCNNSKFVIKGIPLVKTEVINTSGETFEKPAVIICNHQSHIDLMFTLMLSPRIVILTNEWVWNSPFYGRIVKYADFYPVANGIENSIEQLDKLVKSGYSILIFPEGTRSEDCSILRFHRGAFFLAEKLGLDLVPVVFHGIGHALPKSELLLRHGKVTVKILPRITPDNIDFGDGYSQRAKTIRQLFTREYQLLCHEQETPAYYHQLVLHNYIYKGYSVQRNASQQLRQFDNFSRLIESLPNSGKVLVPGCGYGVFSLMLSLVKKELQIIAIDDQEDKINLAANCVSKPAHLSYLTALPENMQLSEFDAVVLIQPEPIDCYQVYLNVKTNIFVLLNKSDQSQQQWINTGMKIASNTEKFTLLIRNDYE